jgi:D-glycero-alpha-D-manno-heptose-7-phosphate kinase
MMTSVHTLLFEQQVEASAPCRIDCGGTWDIKAMALPLQGHQPVTVNMAVNLRTTASLFPFKEGWVKISSQGFPKGETCRKEKLPFHSPFGLFFAAVSYFGFHGLEVRISSRSPVKSALGGSSTALVALIKALSQASVRLGRKKLSKKEILHLSYHLEDGISGGNCGIQDQAAAVYGGVHQWTWRYGNLKAPFERTALLDRQGQVELSNRLLVAYSGRSHVSSNTNRRWIKDFLSCRTRQGWVKVNETVLRLAGAIKKRNWKKAADLLQEEMALRRKLTPEALIPITSKLVRQAEHNGCGARFAGAGAGGSLWAIGRLRNIERLRKTWEVALAPVKGAKILDCGIDSAGVR